jgi:hypothetical protein
VISWSTNEELLHSRQGEKDVLLPENFQMALLSALPAI